MATTLVRNPTDLNTTLERLAELLVSAPTSKPEFAQVKIAIGDAVEILFSTSSSCDEPVAQMLLSLYFDLGLFNRDSLEGYIHHAFWVEHAETAEELAGALRIAKTEAA